MLHNPKFDDETIVLKLQLEPFLQRCLTFLFFTTKYTSFRYFDYVINADLHATNNQKMFGLICVNYKTTHLLEGLFQLIKYLVFIILSLSENKRSSLVKQLDASCPLKWTIN